MNLSVGITSQSLYPFESLARWFPHGKPCRGVYQIFGEKCLLFSCFQQLRSSRTGAPIALDMVSVVTDTKLSTFVYYHDVLLLDLVL